MHTLLGLFDMGADAGDAMEYDTVQTDSSSSGNAARCE